MFKRLLQRKYIGKTVLVGISVFSSIGELEERYQYFGEIISIDNVISIKTKEGSIWTLPPDTKSLRKASKGIYTLKSNGEQIENPDFLSTWNVTKPNECSDE